MSYWQLEQPAQFELEIKKSRFLALAQPCRSRAEAMSFLQHQRHQYPDARHHCWAYVLGDPANAINAASSDDGEPANTAGKPILNVLQHKAVGDLILVVVRYFGGIKLGAGGLVRAYSQAADRVLAGAQLTQAVPLCQWRLSCDFAQEQFVRHWLGLHQGQLLAVDYGQQVALTLSLPAQLTDPQSELAAHGIDCQKLTNSQSSN